MIPTNDLLRSSGQVDVLEAIARVVARGWYVLGSECADFENEFARFCGVPYCVGVANGTDALELAFRALGIGPGTRVATVANAGYYGTAALNLIGARPIFIDVDPINYLMNLDLLRSAVAAEEVDAILATHLFGLMHDMTTIREIADLAAIPLIEDCAQAHGARRNGLAAGSLGDAGCFSFYPTKNLGGIGDGGAVITRDPELFQCLRSLRQYGWETKYRVVRRGGRNSRLDEIQAAVLKAKLPYLDQLNARRRDVAARYSGLISHPKISCPPVRGDEFVSHLYVISCMDRGDLQRHLSVAAIDSDIHYPIPDHLQPVTLGPTSELPVTEQLATRILTLPCFPELTDAEVSYIIRQINSW